jgi:hypothetical protein
VSGAAGIGLGTTAKYPPRTRNGAASNGLGTKIKYLWKTTAAGTRLVITISSGHRPGHHALSS